MSLPETLLTSPEAGLEIPSWMEPLEPKVAKAREFEQLDRLPELTVVLVSAIETLLRRETFLDLISSRLSKSQLLSRVVFVFSDKAPTRRGPAVAECFYTLLRHFDRPDDLEIAIGTAAAEHAVWEAVAKIAAERGVTARRPESADSLGQIREIIAATRDLRARSGKLAANLVATSFGFSVAELADLLGKSRQSVSKTPDSDALQPLLRPFERIARLRAILDDEDFRSWLHLANAELEGRTPVDVIRAGNASVVADLAEDMLTGQPS